MTTTDSAALGLPAPSASSGSAAQRQLRLCEGVRHLVQAFSRTASSAFNLPVALTVCCHETPAALNVGGASAWVHDRRTHELVLAATGGTVGLAEGTRVPADSAAMPAAALRSEGPRAVGSKSGAYEVAIPLRGRRRALGVLMLDGADPGQARQPEFLAAAAELGHQLSSAIENLLLLEDVLSSRRELAHMFDSLEDLVAVCDAQLRVSHTNRTLATRLAAPREQVIDRPLADLLGRDAGRWLQSAGTRESLRAGATETGEFDDPVLGGRFAMTVAPLPTQDGQPGGAVLVARDVTGRVRLEAERAALDERLVQSQKLAGLGRFVAGIAHELNNPLQGVLGHLELLKHQGRIPDDIRRELLAVSREADRAARIVNNLLIFAGGRKAPLRPLRLNAIVSRTLALRAAACRAARIDVVKQLDEGNPRVAANQVLLQQALLNLLVNALQELAAIGGGRIVVSTCVLREAGRVRIQVRDTGRGIAAESLSRIFEPFYSTKEVGKGTGLGLAIVHGVVKDHHGTVSAVNHPDGGAVFTIELPVVMSVPGSRARKTADGGRGAAHHG